MMGEDGRALWKGPARRKETPRQYVVRSTVVVVDVIFCGRRENAWAGGVRFFLRHGGGGLPACLSVPFASFPGLVGLPQATAENNALIFLRGMQSLPVRIS